MTASPFAESLRWHRQQAGLTQAGLAELSGISARQVSVCESGRVLKPQRRTLHALADALGIPAGRLLEPPPVPPDCASGGFAPVAPLALPCTEEEPLSPVAATVQGTPAPVAAHATGAGPDVQRAPVPGEGREGPAGTTLAERQAEQLAAIRRATSALAKDKRNRRARPWQGRDPFRNAVPGARKLPPGDERP